MIGCWRSVEIAFWPVSVIAFSFTDAESSVPPMLVIELDVEIRRKSFRGPPYCLWDMFGNGYSVAGDAAIGEPTVPWDDPGRMGEAISSYSVALACGGLGAIS